LDDLFFAPVQLSHAFIQIRVAQIVAQPMASVK
jgi:hypothetical protein